MSDQSVVSVLIVDYEPAFIGSKHGIRQRTKNDSIPDYFETIEIQEILEYMREVTQSAVADMPEMKRCVPYPQEDRLKMIERVLSLKHERIAYTYVELFDEMMRNVFYGSINPKMVEQFIGEILGYAYIIYKGTYSRCEINSMIKAKVIETSWYM